MTDAHGLTLTTVNIGAADPGALAHFYQCLLGGEIAAEEPDDVFLRGEQQMMIHLEILVDDLERAGAHATACGAVIAHHQPQDDVRVYLDPAGHPFCLWIET